MGKRGIKPEPTRLKELRGNPGRRPLDANEVKFAGSLPDCPQWLGDVGKSVWSEIVSRCSSVEGWLQSVDGWIMGLYCGAWEDFLDARKCCAEQGATCIGEKGSPYLNPNVGRMNKAAERINALGAKLGFSPSDRVGLKLPPTEGQDDPLVAMLKARAKHN